MPKPTKPIQILSPGLPAVISQAEEANVILALLASTLYATQAKTWCEEIASKERFVTPKELGRPVGTKVKMYGSELRSRANQVVLACNALIRVCQSAGIPFDDLYEISAEVDDGLQGDLKELIARLHEAKPKEAKP